MVAKLHLSVILQLYGWKGLKLRFFLYYLVKQWDINMESEF